MAFKIRIMASHGELGRGPVPRLVYQAEAFENEDRFAERKWACEHRHESVEHAYRCGEEWLAQNPKID